MRVTDHHSIPAYVNANINNFVNAHNNQGNFAEDSSGLLALTYDILSVMMKSLLP